MSAKTEGRSGLLSGGSATLAIAVAGWFALGVTTHSPRPAIGDVAAPASEGVGWVTPIAWRGDRTLPTVRPEVRPAVVRQGQPVVFLAHGSDRGSGVASQGCYSGRLPGFDRPGVHTVTCTVRDRAGNIAVGRTTYRVISKVDRHPAQHRAQA